MFLSTPVKHGSMHFGAPLPAVASSMYGPMAERAGVQLRHVDDVAHGAAPLPARVWWGNWIVDCPECKGAEFVFVEHPVMMCAGCWNFAVGGRWRPVAIPEHRHAIERVLRARGVPRERNWTAESVDDLKVENLQHGDRMAADDAA